MSKAWLLDKIHDNNSKSSILTLDMVEFGLPTPADSSSYNTTVTVKAKPGYRIKNTAIVKYNRWSLSVLGAGMVLNSQVDITPDMVFTKLNPVRKNILTMEDLEPFSIPPMQVGESKTLRLYAKPDSYAWVGSIEITLYRANNGSSLDETVLAGLIALDKRVTKLAAGVVTSIEGASGDVTLTDIGLENVDNTHDIDKPVSIAQQAALDLKVDKKSLVMSVVNISTDNLYKGQVVSFMEDGKVVPAKLSDEKLSCCAGIVVSDVIYAGGGIGDIRAYGVVTATHEEWEVATGEVGGLVQGRVYFLSKERGKLTSSPDLSPVTAVRLCSVGRAISTTDFMISIENPIEL